MQLKYLFSEHLDKMHGWHDISKNPNAISILENNLDKVEWICLSKNPSIFEEEYEYLLK